MCIDARWLYIYIYLFIYLSNICNFKTCWGMLRQCSMAVSPGLPILPILHLLLKLRDVEPSSPPFPGWKSHVRFGDLISWVSLVEPQRSPIVWGWKLLTTRLAAVHTGEEMIKFAGPRVPQGRKWLFANSPLPPSSYLTCIFVAKLPQCSLAHPQVSFLKTIR